VAGLSEHANLLTVDLPGHGDSVPASGELSMARLAQAVLAAVDDAGIEQAVFVGHSMGGPVLRQLCRLAPGRVSAIVVIDGFFSLEDPASGDAVLSLYSQNYESLWPAFVDVLITDEAPESLRAAVRKTMLSAPKHTVMSLMAGIYDPAVWAPLDLAAPLLVVMAEKTTLPANYRQLLMAEFEQVDYRVVLGVGHFLQMEKPTLVNEILLEVVASIGS
jgi:pimeloyl-ACP methyl ester carboxylesterase